MISKKQSKTKAKTDRNTKVKRSVRVADYKEKKAKQPVKEDIKDQVEKLQVNKIDDSVSVQLEAFLSHKPYFKFFQDVSIAVSKKDVDRFPDVKSMIPYLFTVVDKDIGFIAAELQYLFNLYSTCIAILKNPASKDNQKEAAENILNEEDVVIIHHHIDELKQAYDKTSTATE